MSQGKIYPTASNVNVFINGIHIDQAYRVDYKDSLTKTPVWGYNDTVYSKALQGRAIVQGILVINYTFPGYLKAVLADNAVFGKNKDVNASNLWRKDTIETDEQKRLIIESLTKSDSVTEKSQRAADIAKSLFPNQFSEKSPPKNNEDYLTDSQLVEEALKEQYLQGNIKKSDPLRMSKNELSYPPVDMEVYFTEPATASWWLLYKGVEFTEVSQQISAAGQDGSSENLFEVYEFICKERQIKRADVPRSSRD